MKTGILIRIIFFVIVIPLVAKIIKNNLQRKRNSESLDINREEDSSKSVDSEIIKINPSTSLDESIFIDSYIHPNYYISTKGFIYIFLYWLLLLIGISFFLLFAVFEVPIIAVISAIIITIIFIFLLKNSIEMNKNKVLINLFSDKITFSRELTQTLFEIPKNKILKLDILVEKGTSIWPDEYIFLEINSEYLQTVIEPLISVDESVEYSQLMKIKFLGEQVSHLKGINKTNFKEQLFKVIYG